MCSMWKLQPIIPALRRLKQEDYKFKVPEQSWLHVYMCLCLKKKNKQRNKHQLQNTKENTLEVSGFSITCVWVICTLWSMCVGNWKQSQLNVLVEVGGGVLEGMGTERAKFKQHGLKAAYISLLSCANLRIFHHILNLQYNSEKREKKMVLKPGRFVFEAQILLHKTNGLWWSLTERVGEN